MIVSGEWGPGTRKKFVGAAPGASPKPRAGPSQRAPRRVAADLGGRVERPELAVRGVPGVALHGPVTCRNRRDAEAPVRTAVGACEAEARGVGHLTSLAPELRSLGVRDLGRRTERGRLRLARARQRRGRL